MTHPPFLLSIYMKMAAMINANKNRETDRCVGVNFKMPLADIAGKGRWCGVRGIRTPDTLLTYTRFPGVPLQPLEHHSLCVVDGVQR